MLIKLILFSLLISILFSIMNHPLTLGLILLVQTLLIGLITGLMNINFWYSYILFLIMVGGMLVLFIYMTSIASNEKFKWNIKFTPILLMLMVLIITFLFLLDNFFNQSLIMTMNNLYYMLNINLNTLNKYISFPNNILMFLMIMYLLITLIAVVKITNMKCGSLRQKF